MLFFVTMLLRGEFTMSARSAYDFAQKKKRCESICAATLVPGHCLAWKHGPISDNEKRRRRADLYDELLLELPIIKPHRNLKELHAMHLYVIECDERDGLLSHLRKREIGASLHYHLPVHRHQAYSGKIRGADI